MKNLCFFVVVLFLSLEGFAQTDVAYTNLVQFEKPSFSEVYDGIAAPEDISETQGDPWGKGFFIDVVASFGGKNVVYSAAQTLWQTSYPPGTVIATTFVNATTI